MFDCIFTCFDEYLLYNDSFLFYKKNLANLGAAELIYKKISERIDNR